MMKLAALTIMSGCAALVQSPEPVPVPVPVEDPAPVPEPIPEFVVEIPEYVARQSPFVIKHCGFLMSDNVKIIFDGKFEVGGLMGWSNTSGCKRQTIMGLNTSGLRTVQFQRNGVLEDDRWVLRVLP